MAHDLEGFAKACRAMAADANKLEARSTQAAALRVKETILVEFRHVAPSLRLRGVGRKGAKIGVRYDKGVKASTAVVRATGPVQLVESPTKAHREPKARKSGKRRVLAIPGVGVRAWANHPGTKGKHPWAKGVAAAVPQVPVVVNEELRRTMVNHFRG